MLGSGKTRLYAYVNNQVPSAAIRLDQFLTANGVRVDERVTILSDGAGEFEKAVNGSVRPLCRILDWFHIAMKFRAIEQSALKHPDLLAPCGRPAQQEIKSAKWLVWHGKAGEQWRGSGRSTTCLGCRPTVPLRRSGGTCARRTGTLRAITSTW